MIESSELIVNPDGTAFHLHVNCNMIADDVILVGDPQRSEFISGYFDKISFRAQNREFNTFTGTYRGKPITVMSTGIGVGNIDIVVNELNVAANFDLEKREPFEKFRRLNLLRLGTCGAVQPDIQIGDYIASEYSVGIDGLAYFYGNSSSVRNVSLENQFMEELEWNNDLPRPYAIKNSDNLLSMFEGFARREMTVSAVGFYAPQGRRVSLPVWSDEYVGRVEKFRYENLRIGNFEMEGAPIAALAQMMGHNAATVCAVIAQRIKGKGNPSYKKIIGNLVEYTLEMIAK